MAEPHTGRQPGHAAGAHGQEPATWQPHPALEEVADLDHDRTARRGYPEAVLCEAKPIQALRLIVTEVNKAGTPTLFTRAGQEQAEVITEVLPEARHHPEARLLAWPPDPPPPTGSEVLVLAAGTSDLPVAREAELTARHLGRETSLVTDVGVAGLHRVLSQLEVLRSAGVVVVAAGMDGALPSVVAGLISVPVVAVPTSVGYGAAFQGLAALLSMLNACAPGVAVVNIDNGYGAGHLAAQITAP